MKDMERFILRSLGFACLLMTVYCIVAAILLGYHVQRDVDGYINRAQVAAQPTKMADYLDTAITNIQKYGADAGSGGYIFHTPDNDFALIFEALTSIRQRLDVVEGMPEGSTEYQVALDDLRGTLREVRNPGGLIWWKHGGAMYLLLMLLFPTVGISLLVFAGERR